MLANPVRDPARVATEAQLREIVLRRYTYDPLTGILTSKTTGAPVGHRHEGYVKVSIFGTKRGVHRIAWLLVHGTLPALLDHINGDKADNRLANLREVSFQANMQNQRKAMRSNRLGVLGVTAKGRRFMAAIGKGNKRFYLGSFDTPQEAHEAYVKAKRQMHEGCTL